jgi:hypothetical protein
MQTRTHARARSPEHSSTFAHSILQIIEIKVKWLQSQNTPYKLALLLVLDYTLHETHVEIDSSEFGM